MTQDAKPRIDRDARREAILDVAREVFLAEGYANASMSAIAAKVGGSKGTLYNYFKNKEELFTAYMVRHCAWQQEAMFELQTELGDIRTALTKLGRTYLAIVLSDFNMLNFRLIVAEAERSPEIGKAFYESGPQSGAERLGGMLRLADEQGLLKVDDPIHAAHQFIGLCQNRMLKARLCNAMPEPTSQQIDADVLPAVEAFLRAYGPDR
ncbi:MAG: TetR/AcrR family transcriptional regulator [Caulobacter sp.]|nr:TetR/AcrR family transcriptional regulator [Caulobacter sp.]